MEWLAWIVQYRQICFLRPDTWPNGGERNHGSGSDFDPTELEVAAHSHLDANARVALVGKCRSTRRLDLNRELQLST